STGGAAVRRGLDVDCPAVDTCILVGQGSSATASGPWVARGNGTSWVRQALPAPPGPAALPGAVACGAADRCVLAGDSAGPTARVWVGPPWAAKQSAAQP